MMKKKQERSIRNCTLMCTYALSTESAMKCEVLLYFYVIMRIKQVEEKGREGPVLAWRALSPS